MDTSLWPRHIASTNQLQLGHVAFADLRGWKALLVAVAPLMLLPPFGLYLVDLSLAQAQPVALLYSFAALQCFQGSWPSSQDWTLARPAVYVIFALFAFAAIGYVALCMGA